MHISSECCVLGTAGASKGTTFFANHCLGHRCRPQAVSNRPARNRANLLEIASAVIRTVP